jgi:hypothetical protein
MIRLASGFVAICAAACAMWAGPLEAQLRPITYDDYYRIQTVGSARISPDGSSTKSRERHVTSWSGLGIAAPLAGLPRASDGRRPERVE